MSIIPNENNCNDEISLQRNYYAETATDYDDMHLFSNKEDEHVIALTILDAITGLHQVSSLLDVGAGTGRVARYLKTSKPNLKVTSVEPVSELREVGYRKGLTNHELIDGNAEQLNFEDGEFDFVCAFGVLHHIRNPRAAIAEMLRVSKYGIFISDCNNFGQGTRLGRMVKQVINAFGLWEAFNFIKTGGKGYTISAGDGLAYSYSIFNDYEFIRSKCVTHIVNTSPGGVNIYKTARHVALWGIKRTKP